MSQKCKKKNLKDVDAGLNSMLEGKLGVGKNLGKHCKARKKDKKVPKRS